jgi:hypothetical protein
MFKYKIIFTYAYDKKREYWWTCVFADNHIEAKTVFIDSTNDWKYELGDIISARKCR